MADHSFVGNIAQGSGMTLDSKNLPKNCPKPASRGLDGAPANAKTEPAGDSDLPDRDRKSKPPDRTPFDRLRAGPEEPSLQRPRWDLFFASLLHPQAGPESHRTSVGGNGRNKSADDEAVTHLFTWSAEVQALTARLEKVADVRQPRVNSLKQAIAEGRYLIHPRQIAAAMLADGLNLG
jgi:flagellar biosynthesis anti-sigma factor FlgM